MKGKLPSKVMDAVLETIPLYIIVLDSEDVVIGWNKDATADIPESVLGKDVRTCHPPNVLPTVKRMLSEMKSGKRDTASFWYPEKGKGMKLVRYYALRENGKYLGCLEADEYIEEIQKLKGTKKELD